jgi:hypothetical protein
MAVLSLIGGCRKAPLRNDIPLYFGVRVSTEFDSLQWAEDLAKVKEYGGRGLAIELALEREPATNWPFLSPAVRRNAAAMARAAAAHGLPVAWVWTRNDNPPLFSSAPTDTAAIYRALLQTIFSVLDSVPRPERVIVGYDYEPVEKFGWECRLAEAVRWRCGCKTTYMYEHNPSKMFLPCFDEAAVAFAALSVEETRKSARIQHSILPDNPPMPIFIAATNVLGWNKAAALEHRRRFLPASANFTGLTINSIFSRPAVCDATTPYGMAGDTAALHFLKRHAAQR